MCRYKFYTFNSIIVIFSTICNNERFNKSYYCVLWDYKYHNLLLFECKYNCYFVFINIYWMSVCIYLLYLLYTKMVSKNVWPGKISIIGFWLSSSYAHYIIYVYVCVSYKLIINNIIQKNIFLLDHQNSVRCKVS